MTTSAKTEVTKTEKTAPKATAKEAPKAAPKVAQKPAAQKPEAAKAPTESTAPAAEKVATPAPEAPASEAPTTPELPTTLGNIFAEMFLGAPVGKPNVGESDESSTNDDFANKFLGALLGDLAEGKLPEGVEFAPEGFVFDLFGSEANEDFCDGPCGVQEVSPDEVFAAGVAEGLNRANHPAYGFGRQQAPAPIVPIQVVDQTTASFGHLVELQKLHVAGILTDAEYEGKKYDILRRIY
jgi:hypothetical protein